MASGLDVDHGICITDVKNATTVSHIRGEFAWPGAVRYLDPSHGPWHAVGCYPFKGESPSDWELCWDREWVCRVPCSKPDMRGRHSGICE